MKTEVFFFPLLFGLLFIEGRGFACFFFFFAKNLLKKHLEENMLLA